MVSDRPYRSGRQISEALAELRRCAGTQFDKEIVAVFCDVIADEIAPESRQAA